MGDKITDSFDWYSPTLTQNSEMKNTFVFNDAIGNLTYNIPKNGTEFNWRIDVNLCVEKLKFDDVISVKSINQSINPMSGT